MLSLIVDISCYLADATKRRNISATRSSAVGESNFETHQIIDKAVDGNTPTVVTISMMSGNKLTVIHTKGEVEASFTVGLDDYTIPVKSDLVLSTNLSALTLSNADTSNDVEVTVIQI